MQNAKCKMKQIGRHLPGQGKACPFYETHFLTLTLTLISIFYVSDESEWDSVAIWSNA
jgi:hypothetical protein